MSNSIIRSIKQSIADVLLADPYFVNIPVMPIVKNEILNELMQGQYSSHPLTIFVDWISLHNADTETPGPWFSNGAFMIEVLELPSLNSTGVDVDEVAENVANALHLAALESQNTVIVNGITKLDNDEFQRNSRLIAVSFPFGFKPRVLPAIGAVTINPLTQGNQTVTLSCMTPGAAIFFTLDGSYPSPRNPAAKIFWQPTPGTLLSQSGYVLQTQDGPVLSPLEVVAGQFLKCRAWLSGFSAPQPDISQFQY